MSAYDHTPVASASKHCDLEGRVACWERITGKHRIHVYPGDSFWRLCVMDCIDKVLAISASVYPNAQDAMDAAIAWTKHPYPLPI
jgi:hypothetical protein